MDASAQQQITEAHQRGEPTALFSELPANMERSNIESKIVRPVRWTGAPFNIDRAPGAETALPAIASSSTALAICDAPVDPLPLPRPAAADAEPR